jgi:SAM-dependent methyltransferase
METLQPEHFSSKDIDSIRADPENNYFTQVLRETLEYTPNPNNVCDVGCGNGLFSAVLKNWTNCRLVGVDGSDYALKQAQLKDFDDLIKIQDFSVDNLPFEDESFDLVINKDVLEHLLHPEHLVFDILRVTRVGGQALIHVPNHFPLFGRLKLLFTNTIDPFNYFPDSRRWDFPHIRFFDQKDFLDLMISVGFKPVVNLCHHFQSFPKIGFFMSNNLKNKISKKNPNLFATGFTYLFRK